MSSNGRKPLSGMRVLELPGPRVQNAGRLLADLGAEVIKVEPPSGDPVRFQEPFLTERHEDEESSRERSISFLYYHAGKQSITLDIEREEGRNLLLRLAETADVLLDGYPAGWLARQGLDADLLKERNPRLIHVEVTAFGRDGPYAHFAETDDICFAMSGLMYISGDPSAPPVVGPSGQAYDIAGIYTAWAVLLALFERLQSGKGQRIDVSIRDCLATEEHTISTWSDEGYNLRRVGSQHQVAVPGSIFPAADGFIHAFVSDTMKGSWQRLNEWMGHPQEWADDPRLEDGLYRREIVDQLDPTFSRFTRERNKEDLSREGQARHLSIVPVYEPGEFIVSEQIEARGFVGQVEHSVHGTMPYPGSPFVIDGIRLRPDRSAPTLGEHNHRVYVEQLGLGSEEWVRLQSEGVV